MKFPVTDGKKRRGRESPELKFFDEVLLVFYNTREPNRRLQGEEQKKTKVGQKPGAFLCLRLA
jgi:hypothetical protein